MQAERDAITIEEEEPVGEYAQLQHQEAEGRSLIRSMVMQPRYALPFLQPGRLVRVLTSAESTPASSDDADAAQEVLLFSAHCVEFSPEHSKWNGSDISEGLQIFQWSAEHIVAYH